MVGLHDCLGWLTCRLCRFGFPLFWWLFRGVLVVNSVVVTGSFVVLKCIGLV